jgi:hypothetical protein
MISKISDGERKRMLYTGDLHNYKFNDIKLLNHLSSGGNYGILAGPGGLRILDDDNGDIKEKIQNKFSITTIKTCGGFSHFYFVSNFDENITFSGGEYKAKGVMVVGPNCHAIDKKKNHEGNYEIIKNVGLITLSKDDILKFIPENKITEKNTTKVNTENNIVLLEQLQVGKSFVEATIFPHLKPEIKELIITETDKSILNSKYSIKSRSERDEKVVVHLVKHGFEKYINSIFMLYPVGNKMKEHEDGQKYLEYTIRKAKSYSGVTDDNIPLLEKEIFSLDKATLKSKINYYLLKVSEIKDDLQRAPILEVIKDKTKMSVKELKERINKLLYEKEDNEIYSLKELMNGKYEKPEFWIDNILLKNSITLIAGKSGRFKTMLALYLTLSLSKGQQFLNTFEVRESPKILYYDLDENGKNKFFWRTKYLMNGMGLSEDVFDRLKITHGFKSDSLEKELETAKEYDVIVLDSYRRFLKGDENKSEITNKFFKEYLGKLKELGKTVIVLIHFKKASFDDFEDDDLVDAIRGSSDIISQADVLYCLIKTDDIVDNVTKNREFDVSIVAPKDRDGSVAKKFSFNVFKNVIKEKTNLKFLGYKKMVNKTTRNKDIIFGIITNCHRIKRSELLIKIRDKIETISTPSIDKILKQLSEEGLIDNTEYGYYKDFVKKVDESIIDKSQTKLVEDKHE